MADENTAPVIDSGSFFGDLLKTASDFGNNYLQFDLLKSQYGATNEAALANKYNAAVNSAAQAQASDVRSGSGNDYVKYGALAIGGLVALMVVAKVLK